MIQTSGHLLVVSPTFLISPVGPRSLRLLLLLLISPPQRHGADGHVLVEMNGGFRALQLKETNVSVSICRKLDYYFVPSIVRRRSRDSCQSPFTVQQFADLMQTQQQHKHVHRLSSTNEHPHAGKGVLRLA